LLLFLKGYLKNNFIQIHLNSFDPEQTHLDFLTTDLHRVLSQSATVRSSHEVNVFNAFALSVDYFNKKHL